MDAQRIEEPLGDAVLAINELKASQAEVIQVVVAQALRLCNADFGTFAPVSAPKRALTVLGSLQHLCVPVGLRDHCVGHLHLAKRTAFGSGDVALLTRFARHAALAIENALLHDQLRTSVEASTELMAIVSHDLRNPLNAIALREQLLLQARVDDTISRHVASVRRSVQTMERMIQSLLDVAKLDAGRLSLDKQATDLAALVEEVTDTIGPIAALHQIHLVSVADALPSCRIDRDRIGQVLQNLLVNAVGFSPVGGVIRVTAFASADDFHVTVADQGPGIAADVLPRVFDRFYTQGSGGGTGLGLHIAKRFVEAHGGAIWVESQPGEGCTFHLTLPKDRL